MKRKKRIGTVGKAIGCVILLFVALFPIYWLVAMAIRPTSEMTGHISIIPHALPAITWTIYPFSRYALMRSGIPLSMPYTMTKSTCKSISGDQSLLS